MEPSRTPLTLLRGLGGAILGGILGYFAFRWLARHGYYGLAIPGALLGLGASLAARAKSLPLGIACGIAALALGILAEWLAFPFVKDKSFTFFLTHLHHLSSPTLLMLALGTALAFWFGQGR